MTNIGILIMVCIILYILFGFLFSLYIAAKTFTDWELMYEQETVFFSLYNNIFIMAIFYYCKMWFNFHNKINKIY